MRTSRPVLLSLLLCCTWLGCSEDDEPTAPDSGTAADAGFDAGMGSEDAGSDAGTGPEDAGADAGPTDGSVRVRRFLRHHTAAGVDARPEDFTRNPVELFVVEGEALVPVAGAAGGPGEYVFPDVPEGTYYLKVGSRFVVTDARTLDVSVNVLGRAEAQPLDAGSPYASMAYLNLSGVEEWNLRDYETLPLVEDPSAELHLVAEELGFVGDISPGEAYLGATRFQHTQAITRISGSLTRFEAEKGDRARVVQLSPRTLGTLPDGGTQNYLTAVRALHLPPLSHDGSEALSLQGTLQPLPQAELPLDWKVSAFAALAAEVNPTATVRGSIFGIYPGPYGQLHGSDTYAGELLRLRRPVGVTADAVGTLTYGNPHPATWNPVTEVSTGFGVQSQVGQAPRFNVSGYILVRDLTSRLAAGPIVPRIRPPRDLTLDGTVAYGSRSLAEGAHVLGWTPPSGRGADAYEVTLWRREMLSSGASTFVRVSTFYVDESATSVRLPPGLLQPGQHYYVTVGAVLAEGYDVSREPLRLNERAVYSEATAVSGLFSVTAAAP
ncbi:fibronectin type III domain-containing protein [Pyxidicoccus fallax]|uniref:Fibronectin type III domain-containing protein n=1 Tax=Pyxidicoccus fallax TaxID=394095 RepID=A0A848LNA0_9BACT|nr:fibronectin type III domain-containing protein [Pyxidicoccus fallax]NMO19325.1 fibronectin type III domain-containing protein [Pyxidicoccus fallax]NPC80017.1 fibronectin type III domain-containing protein [Pyxidicoccus fallax]